MSFDETMLSLNIVSRSFLGLLRPLDYAQTAPVLYLWLTKLAVLIGGVNDYALRAVPLVAGLLLPYATWRVAEQLLPSPTALLATTLVALAPGLVQYAGIVKPYGVDALVTVVLLEVCLHVRAEPASTRRWLTLLATGAIAIALSAPALFVLAAIGIFLFVDWLPRRDRGAGMWLAAVAACWLGLFGVLYLTVYRPAATSGFMQQAWAASFLTPTAFISSTRPWTLVRDSFLTAFLLRPSPIIPVVCFWIVAGVGFTWLGRRRGWITLALLIGPVVVTAIASAFRRYPFSWRLLQFAMPLVAVWLAAGFAVVLERSGARHKGTWAGAAALLLTLIGVNVTHPYREPPVRDLVTEFRTRARPAEPVYVFANCVPAWTLYATNWSVPDSARLAALAQTSDPSSPVLELAYGGRREVIGRPSGIEWYAGVGATKTAPDSGWAAAETARIASAADQTIWLIFTQTYRSEAPVLLAAVTARGGIIDFADERWGASLYRVRFAPPHSGLLHD